MRRYLFTRLLLVVIAVLGWALAIFGGWIAWRGVDLYAADPVLMGTGGGLAIGGLLVVSLTLAARAQVETAATTSAILERLDGMNRRAPSGPPRATDARQQPRLPGQQRRPDA